MTNWWVEAWIRLDENVYLVQQRVNGKVVSEEVRCEPPPMEKLMDVSIGDLYNVAMVCHEANRAYCLTIGDDSQKPWHDAPEWQKQSSMAGVKGLLDNPSLTPEELHQMWCGQKLKDGWRYGPEKDEEKKTHPCMVPYDQLPEDQQMKDHLFHAIVRTLLKLPPGYVHVH